MKRILFYTFSILAFCLYGCDNYDDQRLPARPVHVEIYSARWSVYGVRLYGMADLCKVLCRKAFRGQPTVIPVSAAVLLACGLNNELLAYDMAAPIECQSNVRIEVDEEGSRHCRIS